MFLAAMLAAMHPSHAEAAGSTRLAVTAKVLGVARITSIRVRHAVELTSRDAAAHAVLLPGAATFEVFSNLPGYWLRFEVSDPAVTEVEVLGLGTPIRVGPAGAGAYVALGRAGGARSRRTLDYRIRYAQGVAPGKRPAPLLLSIGND